MKWSKGIWVITVFVYLVFLTIIGVALASAYASTSARYVNVAVALFFILMLVYITLLIPQRVEVTADNVKVHRVLIPVTIPLKKVTYCRRVDKDEIDEAIRVWGSGGFGGYWGWFFHHRTGKFRMFTGDMKNLYSFVLRDGKRFVVSIDPADAQAMAIIERLIGGNKG